MYTCLFFDHYFTILCCTTWVWLPYILRKSNLIKFNEKLNFTSQKLNFALISQILSQSQFLIWYRHYHSLLIKIEDQKLFLIENFASKRSVLYYNWYDLCAFFLICNISECFFDIFLTIEKSELDRLTRKLREYRQRGELRQRWEATSLRGFHQKDGGVEEIERDLMSKWRETEITDDKSCCVWHWRNGVSCFGKAASAIWAEDQEGTSRERCEAAERLLWWWFEVRKFGRCKEHLRDIMFFYYCDVTQICIAIIEIKYSS